MIKDGYEVNIQNLPSDKVHILGTPEEVYEFERNYVLTIYNLIFGRDKRAMIVSSFMDLGSVLPPVFFIVQIFLPPASTHFFMGIRTFL